MNTSLLTNKESYQFNREYILMPTNKYTIITVDTEALPKRAVTDHVRRLIWGEHENGTAGVREMCAVGDEFGVKHVFLWTCAELMPGGTKWAPLSVGWTRPGRMCSCTRIPNICRKISGPNIISNIVRAS